MPPESVHAAPIDFRTEPAAYKHWKLSVENGVLTLSLSRDGARRFGESVQRRLDALGRSFGRRTELRGA